MLFISMIFLDPACIGLRWYFRQPQGLIQGAIGTIVPPPLKHRKETLFTMILYNSENNIPYIRPFCRPLLCHSSVVKYTSFLLQPRSRYETWLPNITEIAPPPNLTGGIRPCRQQHNLRRAGLNECEAPGKIVTAMPPSTLSATVKCFKRPCFKFAETPVKNVKTDAIWQPALQFRDNWGWPCTALRVCLICSNTQWWDCSSLMSTLLCLQTGCETCYRLFYCWSYLRSNNTATNPQMFTSSCSNRCFSACDQGSHWGFFPPRSVF